MSKPLTLFIVLRYIHSRNIYCSFCFIILSLAYSDTIDLLVNEKEESPQLELHFEERTGF